MEKVCEGKEWNCTGMGWLCVGMERPSTVLEKLRYVSEKTREATQGNRLAPQGPGYVWIGDGIDGLRSERECAARTCYGVALPGVDLEEHCAELMRNSMAEEQMSNV